MYTLPHFCRVCLKYDKNLIDLEHIENEPHETLISKLQQCVSEVDWSSDCKPLLCHPCIKRLNTAYHFKKQCLQSSAMIKSYMSLINEKKTAEVKSDDDTVMMISDPNVIKILIGAQDQNAFQNVFLNLIPNADNKDKDTNANIFSNLNDTIQKFIPVDDRNENLEQILTKSKTEELSVEIDPTDFGLDEAENDECPTNDWDELISQTQIATAKTNGTHKVKPNIYGSFMPILPKQSPPIEGQDDSFGNSGRHFLSSQLYTEYQCETCSRAFSTLKLFKHHVRDFHSGKMPFKCEICTNEFYLRHDYDACRASHVKLLETEHITNNCTLSLNNLDAEYDDQQSHSNGNLVCEYCLRQFSTLPGLLRHKVRKHNQQAKKKYFIKGMKNARCDICNRDFSTQSYMQLHRKLHMRDESGYKRKVISRIKYGTFEQHKGLVPIRPKDK